MLATFITAVVGGFVGGIVVAVAICWLNNRIEEET